MYPPSLRPIVPWLQDPNISEIMINGPSSVWLESHGKLQQVESPFKSRDQLIAMIDTMVTNTGRQVTMSRPFVDFRLDDGSRVNVVIPPIALDGPVITIRKMGRSIQTMDDLVKMGTLSERMAYVLYAAIRSKVNIVFSGGSGTGKTTTLAMVSTYISESERIIVIEDTAELELKQRHVVRMECRPPNMEGHGAVDQAELLRNALRMRPTRIIVGEVRGSEAVEMLQAMTSGHDGCLAVLHASTPEHAVSRLEMLILSRGLPLPLWGIQRQIATGVDLIVQMAMHKDGVRRVTHITEVAGSDGGSVVLNDLHTFVHEGIDEHGRVRGHFQASGIKPSWLDRITDLKPKVVERLFREGRD